MDRAPVPVIDRAMLELVMQPLSGRRIEIVSWEAVRIGAQSLGLSAGLFRLTGSAVDGSAWSLVLKVLRPLTPDFFARFPEADHERLRQAYLWDREAQFYASDLVKALPGSFSPARCLGSRRVEGECWLWLEDLGESRPWDVPRYGLAARHLGHLNGAFLGTRADLDDAWLSRDWTRTWVLRGNPSLQHDVLENEAIWRHELVRQSFGPDANARLRRAWERRGELLDRLDALPQTFCHMDAFRLNLFDRTKGSRAETAAIDWSYAGVGPIGFDVGQLVMASVLSFADPTQDIRTLAAAAVPEYIAGLRETGWRGRDSDVLVGFGLSAIRHVFMLGLLRAILDPQRQELFARSTGQFYSDAVTRAGYRTAFLLDLLEHD